MTKQELLAVLKATGEIYGKQVSETAAVMFLVDLNRYTPDQVGRALQRCRRELKTFPSVADVIARIDDGRPGVEEAWASLPRNEQDSCVWTDEMAEAFGACRTLLDSDPIAARMTFKEVYQLTVSRSREEGRPVNWRVSLGFDLNHRVSVMMEAVSKHRLTLEEAQKHVPELDDKRGPTRTKRLPMLEGLVRLAGVLKRVENKEKEDARSEQGGDQQEPGGGAVGGTTPPGDRDGG